MTNAAKTHFDFLFISVSPIQFVSFVLFCSLWLQLNCEVLNKKSILQRLCHALPAITTSTTTKKARKSKFFSLFFARAPASKGNAQQCSHNRSDCDIITCHHFLWLFPLLSRASVSQRWFLSEKESCRCGFFHCCFTVLVFL